MANGYHELKTLEVMNELEKYASKMSDENNKNAEDAIRKLLSDLDRVNYALLKISECRENLLKDEQELNTLMDHNVLKIAHKEVKKKRRKDILRRKILSGTNVSEMVFLTIVI